MQATYVHNTCDDLMVVNPARVSFGKWKEKHDADFSDTKGSDSRLIKYLAKHQHNSPFFHSQISFSLNTKCNDLNFLLSKKEIMTGVEFYENFFRFSLFSFCSILKNYQVENYNDLNPLIQGMFGIVGNQEYDINHTLNSFAIDYQKIQEYTSKKIKQYKIEKFNDEFVIGNFHDNPEIFRLPFLSMRIEVPMFVARQLEKHQVGFFETVNESGIKNLDFLRQEFFAKNEISRRYVDSDPEFYEPDYFRKRPDKSIKQGSEGISEDNPELIKEYKKFIESSRAYYSKLLSHNIAPEQARMILPMSLNTQWIWTASISDYYRLCNLRLDKHTQYESRLVAKQIKDICLKHYPKTWQTISDSVSL